MATPKKKRSYTILYTDGTYLTYDLTKEDFESVKAALCHGEEWKYVAVSIGIIGMENVRSIIEQKEEELEEETPTDTNPPLDQESYNWIKEQIGGF
jgi:hypothetical protein